MPTYDYRCTACKHEFEEFQSMTAKVLKKCPSCKKPALERLIGTGAAVMFKGSGFYQTDYRSEGYKKAASADKPGEASTSDKTSESSSTPAKGAESGGAAKAEPKPASKAEPKTESKQESKSESKAKGTKKPAAS